MMSKNNTQSRFTLTAEEVDTIRFALEVTIEKRKALYDKRYYKMTSEEKRAFERVIYRERNLLTRIKQYQHENKGK